MYFILHSDASDIVKETTGVYVAEKNLEWQRMVVFECRGLEPTSFDPRVHNSAHKR